jgi:sarcosine oxidase subunit gamma
MLERRSALHWHSTLQPGTAHGPPSGREPAVVLAERRPLSILHVCAFAATIDDASKRFSAALGLSIPEPNRFVGDAAKSIRAIGDGIWQAVGAPPLLPAAQVLRTALAGAATVVDLSHARTALQVSGRDAARTLAKHCGIDLHHRAFPAGSATSTRFGQLGITLARLDDLPTFEILVFRGYAEFVFEALIEAGAEFGLKVTGQG